MTVRSTGIANCRRRQPTKPNVTSGPARTTETKLRQKKKKMRPLPISLWALIAAQIEARTTASEEPRLLLPTAVRKMPPDQGAKFHDSYCAFPEHAYRHQQQQYPIDAAAESHFAPAESRPLAGALAARELLREEEGRGEEARWQRREGNSSVALLTPPPMAYRPPFALAMGEVGPWGVGGTTEEDGHGGGSLFRRAAAEVLAVLQRRQWACPSGTRGCGIIGYPNSCCQEGETCVEVQDTGLGPVGCCPAGATCSGGVIGCTDGSTACASDIGGGCCIPGFVCQGVGCEFCLSEEWEGWLANVEL